MELLQDNSGNLKLQRAADLLSKHIQAVTRDPASWASFLRCTGRMYKYSFVDQLLIHAQRPDAVACASIDFWNERMHRWVRRGSKGIALIDRSAPHRPGLKYVFDIHDTYELRLYAANAQTQAPYIWRLGAEHLNPVQRMLSRTYGIDDPDLKKQLTGIVEKLADTYTDDRGKGELVSASAVFSISSRCGLPVEDFVPPKVFDDIANYTAPEEISELGIAVVELAETVLRNIERTVRGYDRWREQRERERSENFGRDDGNRIRAGGRLPDSGVGVEPRGERDGAAGKIRPDEASAPAGERQEAVYGVGTPGTVGRAPRGDRRDGASDGGAVHGAIPAGESNPRGAQEQRPAGVERAHGEPEGTGGGDRDKGADLRLDLPPQQALLFPSEEEQIGAIAQRQREAVASYTTVRGRRYGVGDRIYMVGDQAFDPTVPYRIERIEEKDIALRDLARPEREPRHVNPLFFDRLVCDEPGKKNLQTPQVSPYHDENGMRIRDDQGAKQTPPAPRHDYRIADDALGQGGPKTKYRNNVEAIRTLRRVEAEGRLATPQEQEILSKYTSWGAISQAFDSRNESWSGEYRELSELLTNEEYRAARATTINAFYTSPTVIRAMYEAIGNMGFSQGNVLEPSMGVGNFFGMLPEEMKGVRLYGVELDDVSGRIARQLYQNAEVEIGGFEGTKYRQNFFDLAVGNVPFGNYRVYDPEYDAQKFNIHDYFFAKSLAYVRPGGIVAFVTSKGTLDKANPSTRRYLAERAELLGAVRLPSDAFKENAGTEVTSDIVFLRKRECPVVVEEDWIHLGQTADGIPVNAYFAQHPEMILGRMVRARDLYGNPDETACEPLPGADLAAQLKTALSRIDGKMLTYAVEPEERERASIPADPAVLNWSYALVEDEIYYRENSVMYRVELPALQTGRLRGLIELRDCTRALIESQYRDGSDEEIAGLQSELNDRYGRFTEAYGLINDRANARAMEDDSGYYLLATLEILNANKELERKADIFTKRTVKPHSVPAKVETANEALLLSISEKARVDLDYMASLAGMEKARILEDLSGVIFPNPEKEQLRDGAVLPYYELASEYLSGDIRQKLAAARYHAERRPELYADNVPALEASLPPPVEAHEIDVRLGATWVDAGYVQQFMYELLNTPQRLRGTIEVQFSSHAAEWNITNKGRGEGSVQASSTYGTPRISAYQIIEATLNLQDVRIHDMEMGPDGKERLILNGKETAAAQAKQEAIKNAFKTWTFQDPDRREALVRKYNEIFNQLRPRVYDGTHLTFPGMNPQIRLNAHQVNAIAHQLYGGNTLLAHCVGAGKTFEMIAAIMESKRLGISNKSLMVVPNHLTEQTASEFLKLYPSANLLVARKKDFETENRKKFCAKIATGDYDAIIIGHSQFERIPVSAERHARFIERQMDMIADAIEDMRGDHGAKFTVKKLEKSLKSLKVRLQKVTSQEKKDDVIEFERLGVDKLYIDEAHHYKNLFLMTKMRNVAGIPQTEAQKSADMFLKCRYLDELTGGRGVVFATGTPVLTPYL